MPTSYPSEDARMAGRRQNRAAQDWVAIGRKILDRAEKSVTRKYILNRPFALRGHVTLFYENESYMILPSKNY